MNRVSRSTKGVRVSASKRPDGAQKASPGRAFRCVRSEHGPELRRPRRDGPKRRRSAANDRRVTAESTQGSERCAGPSRRFPRRNLRPTGLRRPAHHFAAPCPPTVFPPRESPLPSVGLSPVGPPKRPSPCGCCTDEWVLCTRPVATRATLGCSRVARLPRPPDAPPNGRCPRREATGALGLSDTRPTDACVARRPQRRQAAGQRRGRSAPPRPGRSPTCPDRSATAFRCPGDAGTHALGWRVAPNSGPRIPHDTNPGGLATHLGRNQSPAPAHWSPCCPWWRSGCWAISSSSGPSSARRKRPGRARARGSRSATRCRPSAA